MSPRNVQEPSARGTRIARKVWIPLVAAIAIAGLATLPTTVGAASPPRTNTLAAGSVLASGGSLVSRNGDYQLSMQRGGNLTLFHKGLIAWQSKTLSHAGAVGRLELDGNFVIEKGATILWKTPAYANHSSATHMVLTDDGDVLIENHDGGGLWSINRPPVLQFGDKGNAVLALQRRLSALGYWLGTQDGNFADSTQQAVWAFQKAAGLERDGVVGPATWSDLDLGIMPVPRKASGNLIEVNLNDDLLMIMRNGKLWATLNTSTGGGYTYTDDGVTSVAITPQGVFSIYSEIDGVDVDSLGTLWRPKFFVGGYAIHGDSDVPPEPVSHGCVRVSDEAINWIWSDNVAPIGTEVWVF